MSFSNFIGLCLIVACFVCLVWILILTVEEANTADDIKATCRATDMHIVSGGSVSRVYDCSGRQP